MQNVSENLLKVFENILLLENDNRIAITKKYPFLLPIVLNIKILIRYLYYTFNINYTDVFTKHIYKNCIKNKWFDIIEHSSPLYRKYNEKDLDEGKITNIKLAIREIDGFILHPGQVFSFWKQIGVTTYIKGYKDGLVLSDGKLQKGVGGGLCQLANLLAYMFACTECEFVERKHHSRDVFPDSGRSIPFASGATVFYNLIDLKVKNTYSFPIKINLRTTETQLRGSISSNFIQDNYIKLEEGESGFVQYGKTGNVYRYNFLYRVFYNKKSKTFINKYLLWENLAKVMYDKSMIKSNIKTI